MPGSQEPLRAREVPRPEHLSQGSSDALYVLEPDAEGQWRYAFLNRAYSEFTGVAAEDVLGRRIADVLAGPTAAAGAQHVAAAVAAGIAIELEHDGEVGGRAVRVAKRITPVFDASGRPVRISVTLRDKGEAVRSTTRLRFQAHLLDEIPIGVVACDQNLVATSWNAFAERLTGRSAAEVVGRPLVEVVETTSRTRDSAVELLAAAGSGERWRGELEIVSADGSTVPLEVCVLPLHDEQGRFDGAVVVG